MIERQHQHVGMHSKALLSDGAYGTGDARAALRDRQVEVEAKLRSLTDSKHIGKDEFTIDLAANEGGGSVTCPEGVTTTDRRMARDGKGRPVPLFRFPREVCAVCDQRDRCLGGPSGRAMQPAREPPGRQVQLHSHEDVLLEGRAAQKAPEQRRALRDRLRPRAKVERKTAECLRRHNLRQGRYRGRKKTDLQAILTATMVNTKRLTTLAAHYPEQGDHLRRALAA